MTDASFFSEDTIINKNLHDVKHKMKKKQQIKGDFYKDNIFKYTNNKNDKMRQFIYTYTYKKQNIKYYYTISTLRSKKSG